MRFVTVLLLLSLCSTASATGWHKKKPRPHIPSTVKQFSDQQLNANLGAEASAGAQSGSNSQSQSDSYSEGSESSSQSRSSAGGGAGGSASSSSGGNTQASHSNVEVNDNGGVSVDSNDKTTYKQNYLSLSLRFPELGGCFKGAQLGGQESNTAGFLGFHLLDKNCWMDKLAQREADVELNARLKCAGRHYRNAIAFEKSSFWIFGKKAKQAACVDMVVASNRKLIEEAKAVVGPTEEKAVDCHPHKPNEHGVLVYDGEEYGHIKKYDPAKVVNQCK